MKKDICFALVVLMVLMCMGGCQLATEFQAGLADLTGKATEPPSAFATAVPEAPEATPEPDTKPTVIMQEVPMETETPEEGCANCRDNPTHRNTDEQALEIGRKHYDNNYRNYQFDEKDIETYRYAFFIDKSEIYTEKGDYTEYTFDGAPYNMHAGDSGESDLTQFKTNKQLLEEYGYDKIDAYAKKAGEFLETYIMYDPQTKASDLEKEYLRIGVEPALAKILSERERLESSDLWFKQDAVSVYYGNYVYRAGNGNLRFRDLCYIRLTDASDKFFEKNPEEKLTQNEWHSHSFEVEMWLDENDKITEYAIAEISEPISVSPEEKAMLNSLKF